MSRPRGIDHLVLGVRDLDAAGAFYQELGFTVGARNRHPWGTHNRLIQFPGAFLELITVAEPSLVPEPEPGRFSFGACVRDALAAGEGISMLALESADAAADNALWESAGIGGFDTFFFERQGRRPDGQPVRVAFTLAFAADAAAHGAGFFVCQQHEPQNFWNPAFQIHDNGARGIAETRFGAPSPPEHRRFLEAFTGAPVQEIDGSLRIDLPRGAIMVERAECQPRWTGFTVAVADLQALRHRLDSRAMVHQWQADEAMLSAFGATIRFVQAEV